MVRNGDEIGVKNVTYALIEEKYIFGGDSRISYGIAAYSNAEVDGSATIVVSVHDITSDKEKLSKLVKDCNDLHLSSVHLYDVVEDFLV